MPPFFVLSTCDSGPLDMDASKAEPIRRGEPRRCPVCRDFTSALPWLPPYRAELECWARRFLDFVRLTPGLLVSERFKQAYQRWRLRGLGEFQPVEIVKVRRHKRSFRDEPPQYYYAPIRDGGAAIDEVASGYAGFSPERPGLLLSVCQSCRRPQGGTFPLRQRRLVLQAGTWLGDDIFHTLGVAYTVCTPDLKRMCDEEKFAGEPLIPAEKYWMDDQPSVDSERVHEIMAHPLDGTVLERINEKGQIIRYEPATRYVVCAEPDGTIFSVCRPLWGEAHKFWLSR